MYTQVPNHFIDEVLATISASSAVVYLVICRQTRGWHKQSDAISISQFMKMTGLTKPTILRALMELEKRGIINTHTSSKTYAYSISETIIIDTVCCEPTSKESLPIHDGKESLPIDDGQKSLPIKPVFGQVSLPISVKKVYTQKKGKKESKKTDTRLHQWQFTVYRELTHLHVPFAWRDKVAELTNEQVWRDVITRWIGKGYRPNGIQGMIDWYQKEEQQNERRNQRQNLGRSQNTTDIQEYIKANQQWTDEV